MAIPFWQIMSHAFLPDARPAQAPGAAATGAVTPFPNRNRQAQAPSSLRAEIVDPEAAASLREAWLDLMDRALEPNVFLEPSFALTAAQHFSQIRRPSFLCVWEDANQFSKGRLLALWPLDTHASRFSPGLLRGWLHPHTSLGLPIIDRSRAAESTDLVLNFLAERFGSKSALLMPRILRGGPTYGLLVSRALATNRAWTILDEHARAILPPGQDPDEILTRALSVKRRKELRRQRRRLEDSGRVTFSSASDPGAIRDSTELFLTLEQKGWKGRQSTSLLSDSSSATFARTMTRLMAREGKCRIDRLDLDGRPLAMGIVLSCRNRSYFWKTAYDETYAAFSPGVQLTLELTRKQFADHSIELTDSCAISDHPMIDRIWPDRQGIVDFMVATSSAPTSRYRRTLGTERARRHVRAVAKSIVYASFSKKRS